MKKKQLEILERINDDRKLDKETKERINKKSFNNFLCAIAVLLFFIVLKLISINIEKQIAILILKALSVIALTFTIILFEFAYKKDNDTVAITSIEMFFLSVITLLTPYIFINRTSRYTSLVGLFFALYYTIKNFIVYRNEKSIYLKEKSDISQIIKKESQDELAKEQLELLRKQKEDQPKRKRGRPKKTKS